MEVRSSRDNALALSLKVAVQVETHLLMFAFLNNSVQSFKDEYFLSIIQYFY